MLVRRQELDSWLAVSLHAQMQRDEEDADKDEAVGGAVCRHLREHLHMGGQVLMQICLNAYIEVGMRSKKAP